jgi:cysteine desulfurase/selenocysteine lyase
MNNIKRKNMKVANALRGEIAEMKDIILYGPEDENLRTSIVSFTSNSKDAKAIVDKLGENEIIFAERDVGGGKKAVRASPHFFNTEEETVRSIEQIKNIVK